MGTTPGHKDHARQDQDQDNRRDNQDNQDNSQAQRSHKTVVESNGPTQP